MRIIAGSLSHVADTFLHPGYISASPAHLLEQGGVAGPLEWLEAMLVQEPFGLVLIGLVLAVVVGGVVVARRRIVSRQAKVWTALLATAITFTSLGAAFMLLMLASGSEAAALP